MPTIYPRKDGVDLQEDLSMEGIADYWESVDQLVNSKSRTVEGGFRGATPWDPEAKFRDMTASQDLALVGRVQR